MVIEIWSDIMCPFCYIGKRRLESALSQLPAGTAIDIQWRSFQLDPDAPRHSDQSTHAYLAARKGWTEAEARRIGQQVTDMAAQEGLHYDFDKSVVANSFDAHRLIHLAQAQGLGDAAKERLLKAYFTNGEHIGDPAVLTKIGEEIGLEASVVAEMLDTEAHTEGVRADIAEAHALGIRGVPFFVFDRKYAISGAQPIEAFLQTLEAVQAEPAGV